MHSKTTELRHIVINLLKKKRSRMLLKALRDKISVKKIDLSSETFKDKWQ
jgi:hypothetical protein